MAQGWPTPVDFIEYDADPSSSNPSARPALGISDSKPYLKALGQTSNAAATAVANQPIGTTAVPAIALSAVGTVTQANSLITANSHIMITLAKVGTDASTSRGPTYWIDSQAAGTVTFGIKAVGVAISASVYVLRYLIIN